MQQTIKLGRVAGIPVGANWTVLVIVVIIAGVLGGSVLPGMAPDTPAVAVWAVAVPTAAVFLASLLAHELAHALMARRYDVGVRGITLWLLGGVSELDDDPPTARADFWIAMAGPATSAGVAVASGLLAFGASFVVPAVLTGAFLWIAVMNALLAVFNLLPGAPLDGGRVLRAVLWRVRGDRAQAQRTAALVGQVVGGALVLFGLVQMLLTRQLGGIWLVLLGWFLVQAARAEGQVTNVRVAAEGVLVRDVMTPSPALAYAWLPIAGFVRGTARTSKQTVFPVAGFGGDPVGVVTVELLARVPQAQATARVDSVAISIPADYLAAPDDPVGPLLGRRPLANALLAVVVLDGQITGMVTVDDMRRLVQLHRFWQPEPQPSTSAA